MFFYFTSLFCSRTNTDERPRHVQIENSIYIIIRGAYDFPIFIWEGNVAASQTEVERIENLDFALKAPACIPLIAVPRDMDYICTYPVDTTISGDGN